MSHIFISYSHKDKDYVHKLQKAFQSEGFEVWIDDRIDYGTRWPKVIQDQLDSCDAFVVVVSENSYESEWVQNEVARAKRKRKPFFPLLLQGDPWLSVETTQYLDVRDNSFPNEKFYKGLETVTSRNKKNIGSEIAKQGLNIGIPFKRNIVFPRNYSEEAIDHVEQWLRELGIDSIQRKGKTELEVSLKTYNHSSAYMLHFYFFQDKFTIESFVFKGVSGNPKNIELFQSTLLAYNGAAAIGMISFAYVPVKNGEFGIVMQTSQDSSSITIEKLKNILSNYHDAYTTHIPKLTQLMRELGLRPTGKVSNLDIILKNIFDD